MYWNGQKVVIHWELYRKHNDDDSHNDLGSEQKPPHLEALKTPEVLTAADVPRLLIIKQTSSSQINLIWNIESPICV